MQGSRDRGADISIDHLAVTAGVSKPVLYDEFGGKVGIADAIALVLAEDLELSVLEEIPTAGGFDVDATIGSVIDSLIGIIVREPELYAFIVRSIRVSDRGFLDNALVRVVRDRATMIIGLVAPDAPASRVAVLTDGLFGFVFAAVESWQETREPDREELVRALSTIIRRGVQAVAEDLSD